MTSSHAPTKQDGVATATTITVQEPGHTPNEDALLAAFGAGYASCRYSIVPAPGSRGTEIHVTSHELSKKELKAGLRTYRALIEAGEVPTGARR